MLLPFKSHGQTDRSPQEEQIDKYGITTRKLDD